MEIILTKEESEKYFHSALCNGLGYIGEYGLELNYKKTDYENAKKSLSKKGETNPCYEDVLVEILRIDGSLKFIDHELGGTYTKKITLSDVHKRVQKTPLSHLTNMIEENDDAETADVIIQTVLYEEIIFG